MPKPPVQLKKFEALLELVSSLRGPEGCPWDLEQNHLTLAPYTLEESAELVEAIESLNDDSLKDELGDVLFQVVLHAQLAKERNAFTIEDVLENLNQKMIRRHPHVFSDQKIKDLDEVWQNWEKIKKAEKKKPTHNFGIPSQLPALQTSYKIGVKCEKSGFDWDQTEDVMSKVHEELDELKVEIKAQNFDKISEELGDVFFSLAQLSRHLNLEPEQVLRLANKKFENRYFQMLQLAKSQGLEFDQISSREKEDLWKKVKDQTLGS